MKTEGISEPISREDVPESGISAAFRLTGHWSVVQPDGYQYLFTWSTESWYRRRAQ